MAKDKTGLAASSFTENKKLW